MHWPIFCSQQTVAISEHQHDDDVREMKEFPDYSSIKDAKTSRSSSRKLASGLLVYELWGVRSPGAWIALSCPLFWMSPVFQLLGLGGQRRNGKWHWGYFYTGWCDLPSLHLHSASSEFLFLYIINGTQPILRFYHFEITWELPKWLI